ncbi:MAG: peptide deformylase [Planctomycetes bacterium]|nr:peptide deformylase [Planctomycetota bacterium]
MLTLCVYPDPVLSAPTAPVTAFDDGLRQLVKEMFDTMYEANGVGLAAPQIGRSLKLVVVDVDRDAPNPLVLANPEIIKKSRQKEVDDEGCLSFPDIRAKVSRFAEVTVRAQDIDGKPFTVEATGLLARCLQHEIDHLDGIFFVNRASLAARLSLRSALKNLEARAQGGSGARER